MDDREFYDRLNRAAQTLVHEAGQPRPGPEAIDRAGRALEELERDPGTAADRERRAALRAAYTLLNRASVGQEAPE